MSARSHASGIALPKRIARLGEVAQDLWWTWNVNARELFRRLDYPMWRRTAHNPVRMLRLLSPRQLREASQHPTFLAFYDQAIADLEATRQARKRWWTEMGGDIPGQCIAYFSAEFALHQSLPIYAGGLGVLAGDICKEASDLGLPFVGIGFMYPQGYFHQLVTPEGVQREEYEQIDWESAPIEQARTPDGSRCIVEVPLGNRTVQVGVWHVRLGRTKLYLLDTGLEGNAPWDRELSARLYGGDQETRVQQEIILGVGGVRALRALGNSPAVWHLNEGHAAFVALERIQKLLTEGREFAGALEEVRRTTVFTTHTPVPAGHDAFPFGLVETHLEGCWGSLGPNRQAFLELGTYDAGTGPQFNMTALALRTAARVNAVSSVHASVTRKMWAPVWAEPPAHPGAKRPLDSAPAGGHVETVTNGVHLRSWVGPEMARLFDHYVGADWRERQDEPTVWDRIHTIPDAELWVARQALRNYLFTFIRERARQRWTDEGVGAGRVVAGGTLLDPAALTIGFARRFTGYKRPDLIFRNLQRLAALLSSARCPVQVVFAGKAHPADNDGKLLLQRVYQAALDPVLGGRIAFVDDYDLHVAHFIVQGCDVWLNTPRQPLEASGTSGMKASVNGVPHLSVGDGWWAEGYTARNGWLIAGAGEDMDPGTADDADAHSLYELLETQVVPMFYDRDEHGVPQRWLQVVREAIRTVAPQFCARRMVKQYVQQLYAPALTAARQSLPSSSEER